MGTRLFIGNLAYGVTEQELREAFSGEGIEVRSVRVALDRESGRPRGFAFVETATDEGAKASIEKISGRILQGRPILVEEAQARAAGPRPGGFGGPPRPPGAAPSGPMRPSGFGGPPRPFGPPGGAPRFGAGPAADARFGPNAPPKTGLGSSRRDRPEKKKSTRPKPEERERGNWRWNGKVDED